jgi:hypothetical protein
MASRYPQLKGDEDLSLVSEARLRFLLEKGYRFENNLVWKNWRNRLKFMTNIQNIHGGIFVLSDLEPTVGNAMVWRTATRLVHNGMAEMFFVDDTRVALKLTDMGISWVKNRKLWFNRKYANFLRKPLEDSGGKYMEDLSNGLAS